MSTVVPVLKRLHSPDVLNLERFSPEDPTCFGFLLQAMFGPDRGEGEESFDIVVCTALWFAREVERKGIVEGRHHLFVKEYDLERLRSFLVDYANGCAGETWLQAASKLSRLGKWEFEDYKS
jgi:immunity protein 8 of polymorphic toxin system